MGTRAASKGRTELDVRTYPCDIAATFHDMRGKRDQMLDISQVCPLRLMEQ